jgi:hypothetical protein
MKNKTHKYLLSVLIFFISSTIFSQEINKKDQISYIIKEVNLTEKEIVTLNLAEAYVVNALYNYVKENEKNEENKKFIKEVIENIRIQPTDTSKFTKENYPGKELGYPFEWWKNQKWIKENIKLQD